MSSVTGGRHSSICQYATGVFDPRGPIFAAVGHHINLQPYVAMFSGSPFSRYWEDGHTTSSSRRLSTCSSLFPGKGQGNGILRPKAARFSCGLRPHYSNNHIGAIFAAGGRRSPIIHFGHWSKAFWVSVPALQLVDNHTSLSFMGLYTYNVVFCSCRARQRWCKIVCNELENFFRLGPVWDS